MKFEQKLVTLLQKAIKKHSPAHEIEIRLGKKVKTKSGHTRFDPNLGESKFNLLLEQLHSEYPNSYEKYEFQEYKIGTLRLRLDMSGNQIEFIRKKRLSNTDVDMGDGLFARISVSEEALMNEEFKGSPRSKPIIKRRHVFADSSYQFELTAIERNSRGILVKEYYLEVELLGH